MRKVIAAALAVSRVGPPGSGVSRVIGECLDFISARHRLLVLLGIVALPIWLLQCVTWFGQLGFAFPHDEAEHLHVVFALERGEVPYQGFIENHPMLFHLGLIGLKHLLGLRDAIQVYWLGKSLVLAHFLGCVGLLMVLLATMRRPTVALPLALALMGIWNVSDVKHDYLWQLRPDWVCSFYSLGCVGLHYTYHRRLLSAQKPPPVAFIVLAAISGGIATAIMAKSIYFFLPYGLTLLLIGIDHRVESARILALKWKPFLVANVLFLAVACFSFAAALLGELSLSGASAADYWKANVVLNSTKHLVARAEDANPFNVLRSFLGMGFVATAGLSVWFLLKILNAHRHHRIEEFGLMCFVGLTLVVNAALPAFSNGLVWPQYFIPSLLALALLLASLLADISAWVGSMRERNIPVRLQAAARQFVGLALAFVAAAALGVKWNDAVARVDNLRFIEKLRRTLTQTNDRRPLPELYMPEDLSYLVFGPQAKPAAAKAWGYFFMLAPDQHIWWDNYQVGIGPDPRNYWRSLYESAPPDVIALRGEEDFKAVQRLVSLRQGVDVGWLLPRMQHDFACMTIKTLRVQVRKALAPRFRDAGWRPCPLQTLNEHDDDTDG